jgi:predicted TIM-barrel fold metal-dependent hydrolase
MKEFTDRSTIERLRFFDANCSLGVSDLTVGAAPTGVCSLITEMDRLGIAEALVYHASAAGYSPSFGNAKLAEELGGNQRLHGCWVVMPHYTGELQNPLSLVRNMLAAGIRAARLIPRRHRFSLSAWSVDELLSVLADHRVPVFLDFGRSHWAEEVVDYDQVARICTGFPFLPLILVREGIGSTRYLYPLLEKFANLFIEVSYYQAAEGLADICQRFGPSHLLFGTGLPEYAAGPAIAMLHYAQISFEEKRLIAGDSFRRLLQAVRE